VVPSPKGSVMLINRITLLLLLFFAFKAFSTETFRVGLIESYPWAYRTESNVITGIYPELFNQLEQSTNLQFKIQLMPLARIIHEVKNSHLDITIMSQHATRKINMEPLLTIYKTPFVLLTKLNSKIKTLADIKNKNVAMLIGGSGCPCLDEDTPYQRRKVSKHLQGLKMLMANRVDAVSGPYIRLSERVKTLNIQNKIAPPIIYHWRTVSLWTSHELAQNSTNLNFLSKEINKRLKTGFMKELLNEHFSPDELSYILSAK
jgi:ABC-type amino acid transport substrate-binding protein